MSPTTLIVVYCVLILSASLAGGWIPLLLRLTHRRMEMLLSFVSGVMLGVALLHLLPHALEARAEAGYAGADLIDAVIWWMLGGFLSMFFIERFFCFHHHDIPGHAHGSASPTHGTGHELTWTGAVVGLSVHSLIGGAALAASVAGSGSAGFGVFLAIFLHKPFDALTVGTLMAAGQRSRRMRHLVNGAFGLVVPIGAIGLLVTAGQGPAPGFLAAALAFSAGTFLCISLSDLLPELQFHQHDRIKLSLALLAGLAVAWATGLPSAPH